MAQRKKNDPAALRGKFIVARNLAGIVLNNADTENHIVLQVTRERKERKNDIIAQLSGWMPDSSWWVASNRMLNTTREHLGPFEVLEKMPKWLYLRSLSGPSGAPSVTTVRGRRYIDW